MVVPFSVLVGRASVLTVVHGRKQREHLVRAIETVAERVVCTTHVPLDAERALEVLIVRGRASDLAALAGRIGGARGVLAAELAIAAVADP